ncbi:mitochondral 37S ribosomal protein S27 [Xylographa soralifera]|nr:mitochondral 37S ribosomal protein S27 [Xylographa soralifera]
MRHLMKAYPDLETWDEEQEDRLEGIALKKQRGKGAPKKKRSAEESKKFASRKKKPTMVL